MFDTLSIVRTPAAARRLFPAALWKVKTKEKILYLTFDDGPIAEVTPLVLAELERYQAKATFFCIGKNINAHPDIFQTVYSSGHAIGNHTQDHLHGWQTANELYFENVARCAATMDGFHLQSSKEMNDAYHGESVFFRPPYGKISLAQYRQLKKSYKVVMWDVLSFDFDLNVSKEQVLQNVLDYAGPGSIIVFHDSLKARDKVLYALPRVLEHYSSLGYKFEALDKIAAGE